LYFKRNHRCPAGLPFLDDWPVNTKWDKHLRF
jgi:hypothetical protein